MGSVEAAGAPRAGTQTTNKVFSILLKVDVNHDGAQEWRRKLNASKTLANFKTYFSAEMKDHKKKNELALKASGC